MTSKLYDVLVAELIAPLPAHPDYIMSRFGKNTEFEAMSKIMCDEEDGMWDGFLVFKDYRFSPLEEIEMLENAIQFKYQTPGAANGVLAYQRAKEYWETMCNIFQQLMEKGS